MSSFPLPFFFRQRLRCYGCGETVRLITMSPRENPIGWRCARCSATIKRPADPIAELEELVAGEQQLGLETREPSDREATLSEIESVNLAEPNGSGSLFSGEAPKRTRLGGRLPRGGRPRE